MIACELGQRGVCKESGLASIADEDFFGAKGVTDVHDKTALRLDVERELDFIINHRWSVLDDVKYCRVHPLQSIIAVSHEEYIEHFEEVISLN